MAAAAQSIEEKISAPRDLGKSARIRAWFGQRKEDGFPGNHLNNAVFATFALSWFGRLRASSYALREIVDLDLDAERALHAIGIYWAFLPTWPRKGPDNLPWTSAGGY